MLSSRIPGHRRGNCTEEGWKTSSSRNASVERGLSELPDDRLPAGRCRSVSEGLGGAFSRPSSAVVDDSAASMHASIKVITYGLCVAGFSIFAMFAVLALQLSSFKAEVWRTSEVRSQQVLGEVSAQVQGHAKGMRVELSEVLDSKLYALKAELRRDLALEIRHQVEAISTQIQIQGSGKLADLASLLDTKLKEHHTTAGDSNFPVVAGLVEIDELLDRKLKGVMPAARLPESISQMERTLESLERAEHHLADELHELGGRLKAGAGVPDAEALASRTINLETFSKVSDLPLNGSLLGTHVLLVPEGCKESAVYAEDAQPNLDMRRVGIASGELAKDLRIEGRCPEAVCLWKGVASDALDQGLKRFSSNQGETFNDWAERACQHVELGFRNLGNEALDIFWVHPDYKNNIFQGQLPPYKEKKDVFWRTARLGHQFIAMSSTTNQVVRRVTVEHVLSIYRLPVNGTLPLQGQVLDNGEPDPNAHGAMLEL